MFKNLGPQDFGEDFRKITYIKSPSPTKTQFLIEKVYAIHFFKSLKKTQDALIPVLVLFRFFIFNSMALFSNVYML